MDKSLKGKRSLNQQTSPKEGSKKKRTSAERTSSSATVANHPTRSTLPIGPDPSMTGSNQGTPQAKNQNERAETNQLVLNAMRAIEKMKTAKRNLNLGEETDRSREEGDITSTPSNKTDSQPRTQETDRADPLEQGSQGSSRQQMGKESDEDAGKSNKERRDAINAVLKAQKEVLNKLSDNMNHSKILLKAIDPKKDNQHLIAELHHHTLHLAAVSKWITCRDFILPYDLESYEKFCEAEDAIPPNRLREEMQTETTMEPLTSKAVAEEIIALFKQKLEENIMEIREARNRKELVLPEQAEQQKDEEVSRDESRRERKEPAREEEGKREDRSKEYVPVNAKNIWICSPNEEPLSSFIKKHKLVALLNQGELETEEDFKLVYAFPTQEKAMKIFNTLNANLEEFTLEGRPKPYLGLPSHGGKKTFKIRIENIPIKDLKKWWKMMHSEEEEYQADFLANLVERNKHLFVSHDLMDMESWTTKSKDRSTSNKDHLAIALMVGPMTFDRCKKKQTIGQAEALIWPTESMYAKRIVKYEEKRKENKQLERIEHQPARNIPSNKKRLWPSYYPHVCGSCFSTGHSTEDCEEENPPSPRPCSKCKSLGRKGSQTDHKTNSFSCKWYRNLSNRLESMAANHQGGY